MNQDPNTYTIPVYKLQLVQEGTAETTAITGPADLAFHLKEIATADREHMVVIFLDTKNRPIGRQVVSIGTLNATLVDARGVFRAALLNATTNSVAIAHNLCEASHKLCCVKRWVMCSRAQEASGND